MNYVIHPGWFYLMSVGEKVSFVAGFLALITGIISAVVICFYIAMREDEHLYKNELKAFTELKLVKRLVITFIVTLVLFLLIPGANTCKEMMVASVITEENINATEEHIDKVIDKIIDKIEGFDNGGNESGEE